MLNRKNEINFVAQLIHTLLKESGLVLTVDNLPNGESGLVLIDRGTKYYFKNVEDVE